MVNIAAENNEKTHLTNAEPNYRDGGNSGNLIAVMGAPNYRDGAPNYRDEAPNSRDGAFDGAPNNRDGARNNRDGS